MNQEDTIAPPLPSDERAEQRILGALLGESDRQEEILDRLEPEDFFNPYHLFLFRLIQRLHEETEPINLLTVTDLLLKNPADEKNAGGIAYVSGLGDGQPRIDNTVPLLIANIRRASRLRSVAWVGEHLRNMALTNTEAAASLTDWAIEKLLEVGDTEEEGNGGTAERRAAANLLMSLTSTASTKRILTGIPKLDKTTGGFMAGEVVVVTAETGVGKTFLVLQMKREACRNGMHGLFVSGEMLAEQLMGRHLATVSGVPHWKLRRPDRIGNEELSTLTKAASEQCEICRILDSEHGDFSLRRIRLAARAKAARKELSWLVIDYDELVEVPGCKDEWTEQKILVRSLKSLAMQLKVPVILISQLRKPLNQQQRLRPTLADLYGSAAKTKAASFVIYVDRPFVPTLSGDPSESKLYLLKSRESTQGTVECLFDPKTLTFQEKAGAEFMDTQSTQPST